MPHQVTFLSRALRMWLESRGGICADGMGKTHQIRSMILMLQRYKRIKNRKDGRTLIVTRESGMNERKKNLTQNLNRLPGNPHPWQVYYIERGVSMYQPAMRESRSVTLAPEDPAWPPERPQGLPRVM